MGFSLWFCPRYSNWRQLTITDLLQFALAFFPLVIPFCAVSVLEAVAGLCSQSYCGTVQSELLPPRTAAVPERTSQI